MIKKNSNTVLRKLLFIFVLLIVSIFSIVFILNKELKNKKEKNEDLIIKTNKTIYEYGEPVEVEVTRYFPKENEESYIIRNCNFLISSEVLELDCTNIDQCKDYCSSLSFKIKKLETNKVVWDQKACFEPVPPGNYDVRIKCNVADFKGEGIYHYFIISDGINVLINEPH